MDEEENISWEQYFINGANNEVSMYSPEETKPVIFRGVVKRKYIHKCWEDKRTFYYMDTGYFGNFKSLANDSGKKIYHRIVKNQLQNTEIGNFPADRWDHLVKGDPRLKWAGWKKYDKKILLVLPNPKACAFYGFELDSWLKNTIEQIKKQTDMPIEIREKGSRSYRGTVYTIYDAFDSGVHATVAFNSIAAIESIAYGIPAFVSVPCAASPLASTDLSQILTPHYPDPALIEQHCRGLAYSQFTGEEIADGTAWKILKKYSK
jgi:hypothetical protein